MVREAATALMALSVILLTLLVPLHQSAASQRDFAAVGFASFSTWTICTAQPSQSDPGKPVSSYVCPVSGLSKAQMPTMASITLDTIYPTKRDIIPAWTLADAEQAFLLVSPARPRGPPAAL